MNVLRHPRPGPHPDHVHHRPPSPGRRRISSIASLGALAVAVTACGDAGLDDGSGGSGGSGGNTFTIGFVTPQTGAYAAFGEGDQWVADQMQDWFDKHPLQVGGKDVKVDVIVKDSQSSPQRAAEVAGDLINSDGADVLFSQAAPDTTVPVDQQCEANQVLCLSTVTPWQPWVAGMGGNPADPSTAPEYSYHFFFGAEDAGKVFVDMWSQVDTNKQVAALFPNDPDGKAFTDPETGFPPVLASAGYSFDNPGLYPPGTQDFSSQISRFKENGDEILVGLMPPPDFALAWKQMKQQGFLPKVASVGKATEFPSAVQALGDLADNLTTSVWWAPSYPTSSDLTGMTSAEFATSYSDSTGKLWNMALPYSESLFEVLAAAVTQADSTDVDAIRDALVKLDVDTLVGKIDFADGPFPHVAHTNVSGGQWRVGPDGKLGLVIVSNVLFPELKVEDRVEPLS